MHKIMPIYIKKLFIVIQRFGKPSSQKIEIFTFCRNCQRDFCYFRRLYRRNLYPGRSETLIFQVFDYALSSKYVFIIKFKCSRDEQKMSNQKYRICSSKQNFYLKPQKSFSSTSIYPRKLFFL